MTLVQVTYEDGFSEDVELRGSAFGTDGTAMHGHVIEARISPRNSRPSGHTVESLMGQRRPLSYTPIYGTGRNR
jgi:hypothetical protein